MIAEETKTLLSGVVTHLPDLWAQRSDSLTEFTRQTRNDFLTLVESDLITVDYLPQILDRAQTLVSGYFLSAVSLLVDIPEINVRRTLDKVSTNRDPIESILGAGSSVYKFVGTESFEHGLPSLDKLNGGSIATECFALESKDDKDKGGFGVGRNALATVDELSNLSTGKILEVNFERNGNKKVVPVTIRLAVTDTDSQSMKTILAASGIQNEFSERWRRMRSGELSMVKDLLFCHDLIEESRRMRVRDKSGFYEHMMRRRSKNFLSGLFSLSPSINNASAVLVCSQETADAASFEHGGSMDSFKIREKIFKSTAAMLIFVVDTKWDTVTIYHRGIDSANHISSRDLKRGGNSGGGSVDDIINAYQAGSVPAI